MKTHPYLPLLIILTVSSACQDTTMVASRPKTGTVGAGESEIKNPANPESGDGILAAPATPPVSVGGASDQDITSEPAIAPVSVAGASLTCSLVSTNTELRCDTKAGSANVDLITPIFYGITEKAAAWKKLDMVRLGVGAYKAPVPTGLPSQFAVVLRYENTKYTSTLVGSGRMPYDNAIVDGTFTNMQFPGTGGLYADALPLDANFLASPWDLMVNEYSGCGDSGGVFRLYAHNNEGLESSLDAEKRSRWIGLDNRCASEDIQTGVGGNITVKQDIGVTPANIYHVSFATKKTEGLATTKVDAQLFVYWGEFKLGIVTPDEKAWHYTSYTQRPQGERVRFNFAEVGEANNHGSLLKDVMILNLGAPPAL